MARYLLNVYSRAIVGHEAEYRRWYADRHLSDVLALEGFDAAERFEPVALEAIPLRGDEFLAIYEIEIEDPTDVLSRLSAAVEEGMDISPALDLSSVRMELWRSATRLTR